MSASKIALSIVGLGKDWGVRLPQLTIVSLKSPRLQCLVKNSRKRWLAQKKVWMQVNRGSSIKKEGEERAVFTSDSLGDDKANRPSPRRTFQKGIIKIISAYSQN